MKRHMSAVYYTRRLRDRFRKYYWVGCFKCDLKLGPFPDRGFANLVSLDQQGSFGDGREFCSE